MDSSCRDGHRIHSKGKEHQVVKHEHNRIAMGVKDTNLGARYQEMLRPSEALVSFVSSLSGDIMVLGAGGKMGPSLSRLAKDAIQEAGVKKKVIAVARFSDAIVEHELRQTGIETIKGDLLNSDDVQSLPDAENVLYLAGTKFGTSGNESQTWAMNSFVPGRVAEKFSHSRIVAFSTGNVYPFVAVDSGGATENTKPEPVGEYAQSCLGRERVFQFFSVRNNTPVLIYRLNYANDVSYGVLSDIAVAVKDGKPIDLTMGYVNVIWQQDANDIAIRSLAHCEVPPRILNVTGPETLSVKSLAIKFGSLLGREPVFVHRESETALLSDASQAVRLFGPPSVSTDQMIDLIAGWIKAGGKMLNKPTHFQERKGNF